MMVFWTTQLVAFPLGIVICWLRARTNIPWARGLEFVFWLVWFLPNLSVLQGWILVLHPSAGLANLAIVKAANFLGMEMSKGPFNIYSFWGIVFSHLAIGSIAIRVMLLTPAFRNMDASLEEASRISGASSLHTLARVTVPVLIPAIVIIFMLGFVRAFQSVEIELILGLPIKFFVFGSKIFDLVRTEPPMFGAATAMGLIVLVGVAPLLYWQRWMSTRRHYTTLTGQFKPQVLDLGRWRWPAFAFVASIAFGMLVLPMVFLLMGTFMKLFGFFEVPGGAFTTKWWTTILQDSVFLKSIKNTMWLALGSATINVIFLTLIAYVIVRTRLKGRGVMDFMTWVPSALPGIVFALAWLYFFIRTPFMRPLHGSIFALILVSSVGGITLGVQIIKANLLQLGNDIEEASTVTGASLFTTLRRVLVPLLIPTVAVIWVIHFVGAAGSAIMPALLGSPASRPLALLQLEHQMSGQQEAASVVGVIVTLITMGVAGAAYAFGIKLRGGGGGRGGSRPTATF
jgi:iron(III) transport system permease protein